MNLNFPAIQQVSENEQESVTQANLNIQNKKYGLIEKLG